jgi:hypothetical protein
VLIESVHEPVQVLDKLTVMTNQLRDVSYLDEPNADSLSFELD